MDVVLHEGCAVEVVCVCEEVLARGRACADLVGGGWCGVGFVGLRGFELDGRGLGGRWVPAALPAP